MNQRILTGLLVPAILLAIWLCPCSQSAKAAEPQTNSHKCCESKSQSPKGEKPQPEKDCPHCTGGPSVTAEQSKVAVFKVNLNKLLPLLHFDPLYLVQTASVKLRAEVFLPVPAPPIRLRTCTFLC